MGDPEHLDVQLLADENSFVSNATFQTGPGILGGQRDLRVTFTTSVSGGTGSVAFGIGTSGFRVFSSGEIQRSTPTQSPCVSIRLSTHLLLTDTLPTGSVETLSLTIQWSVLLVFVT
jgi:hypothetical protein